MVPKDNSNFIFPNGKEPNEIGYSKAKYHRIKEENDEPQMELLEEDTDEDEESIIFRRQNVMNRTTDLATFAHLLCASLGVGILTMPAAFKYSGLIVGIFAMFFVAVICTHCSHILLNCAHVLCNRHQKDQMTFAEITQIAIETGPNLTRPFAKSARYLVQACLIILNFGGCSITTIVAATKFKEVWNYQLETDIELRFTIFALLGPIILISWVPDLKNLALVSSVASISMMIALGITVFDFVQDMPPPTTRPMSAPISELPNFISFGIFSLTVIDVTMPLQNDMQKPSHLRGFCGVLNIGTICVAVIYIIFGILGFIKYGNDAQSVVTSNLPIKKWKFQVTRILIGLSTQSSYGLQFFVCLESVWDLTKHFFQSSPKLGNYIVRTSLATAMVLVAGAIPAIAPFINLLGAFCISILGLLIPVLIDITTFWGSNSKLLHWRALKNVVIFTIGLIVLVFGTIHSVRELAQTLFN